MWNSNSQGGQSIKVLLTTAASAFMALGSHADTKGYDLYLDRPAFAKAVQRAAERGRPELGDEILARLVPANLSAREIKWYYHVACFTAVELGSYQEAIAKCSVSIEHSAEFYQDYINRGAAYAMTGSFAEAINDYRTAIRHGGDAEQIRRVISFIRSEQVKLGSSE